MSWPVRAAVLDWAAWAPGISSTAEWQTWANGELPITAEPDSPPVDFVPAIQRRRLSRLSRLSLAVAHACVGHRQDLATVFASRHGELYRTAGLLGDLAQGEPLSPMAFSLSVHNTASGLYAIQSGNRAPSAAIAAGADTLAMALVEAAGQLLHREQVLLVYADEPLPACYRDAPGSNSASIPFGLALLLGRTGTGSDWTLAPAARDEPTDEDAGLALLRALAGDDGVASWHGERHGWHWSLA